MQTPVTTTFRETEPRTKRPSVGQSDSPPRVGVALADAEDGEVTRLRDPHDPLEALGEIRRRSFRLPERERDAPERDRRAADGQKGGAAAPAPDCLTELARLVPE